MVVMIPLLFCAHAVANSLTCGLQLIASFRIRDDCNTAIPLHHSPRPRCSKMICAWMELFAVCSNLKSPLVSFLLQSFTGAFVSSIDLPEATSNFGLAVSNDGTVAAVSNSKTNAVYILSLSGGSLIRTLGGECLKSSPAPPSPIFKAEGTTALLTLTSMFRSSKFGIVRLILVVSAGIVCVVLIK